MTTTVVIGNEMSSIVTTRLLCANFKTGLSRSITGLTFLSDTRKFVCDGVGAIVTTGGELLLDADWLFE